MALCGVVLITSLLCLTLWGSFPSSSSSLVLDSEASSEGLVTAEAIPSTVKEGGTGLKLHCRYTSNQNGTVRRISWSRLRDNNSNNDDNNNPEIIFEKFLTRNRHAGNYSFFGSWKGRKGQHDVTSFGDVTLAGGDITRGDAGTYRCEVSGDAQVVHGDAAVTVLYGPGSSVRITSQRGSFRVREGETITLVCSASCVPSCQFRWTCSGCRATRAAMLTIPSIQRDQSGKYTCLAYNTVSRGRADVTVDVLYPASIRQLLFAEGGKTLEVEEGHSVSINCQATGNPPPHSVTWSVTGQSKDNKTFEMGYGKDRSSVYMLSSARCQDNDKFTCTAENSLGADVGSVHLKVLCSSIHPCYRGNQTRRTVIPFASSDNLTTCVVARPMPTVQWYHVTHDDVMTPVTAYDVMYDDITATMMTSVGVTTAEPADYGLYRVAVENERGTYEETFSVEAKEQPLPPYNLTVTNVTMTSFCMTWLPAFDGGAPQTFHVTYYTRSDDDEIRVSLEDRHDVTLNYCAEGLKEDAVYYVILLAENEHGRSGEATINVTTLGEMKSEQLTSRTAMLGIKVGLPLGGALLLFVVVSLLLLYRRRHHRSRRQIEQNTETKHVIPLCIINENARLSYLENDQENYVDAASTATVADVNSTNDVSGDVTSGTGMERSGSWLFGTRRRRLGVEDLSRRPSNSSSANIYLDVLSDPSTYINQDLPEDSNGSAYMNGETDPDYEDTSVGIFTIPAETQAEITGTVEVYVDMTRQTTSPDDVSTSDDVAGDAGDVDSPHDANSHDVSSSDGVINVHYDDAWCVKALPVLTATERRIAASVPRQESSSDTAASRKRRSRSPQYGGVVPTITVTPDEEGATKGRESNAYDVSNAVEEDEHIYDVIRDSDVDD